MKIAIFASGRGSNFSAIIRAAKKGTIPADIALLVCDNPQAKVIQKAKRAKVKVALVKREDFSSKREFEERIISHLRESQIDLVVLAGFMRLLSGEFVQAFAGRIINIHPALLPAFKGEHGIQDAFDYGVKIAGVTVHFVDEKMDHGPIILQEQVRINEGEAADSFEKRIHKIEHKLYPRAIRLILEGRVKIAGRKTVIS